MGSDGWWVPREVGHDEYHPRVVWLGTDLTLWPPAGLRRGRVRRWFQKHTWRPSAFICACGWRGRWWWTRQRGLRDFLHHRDEPHERFDLTAGVDMPVGTRVQVTDGSAGVRYGVVVATPHPGVVTLYVGPGPGPGPAKPEPRAEPLSSRPWWTL